MFPAETLAASLILKSAFHTSFFFFIVTLSRPSNYYVEDEDIIQAEK